MISLLKIINEGKQVGIIYHFTYLKNLLYILNDNALISSGTRERGNNKDSKVIQISFSRNKNLHKVNDDIIKYASVRIVIDGDKLSDRYKLQPFNYFNKHTRSVDLPVYNEYEERVIFDIESAGVIRNIDSYVYSYDIILDNVKMNVMDINNLSKLNVKMSKKFKFFIKDIDVTKSAVTSGEETFEYIYNKLSSNIY